MRKNRLIIPLVLGIILALWAGSHTAGVLYGTKDIPLHESYIGDEPSPVHGALHMLEKKSILGLRNEESLYYGPILAVFAVPAVVVDVALQYTFAGVRSGEAYKQSLVMNWGGIVTNLHITTVLASVLALVVLFKMFSLKTLNPTTRIVPVLIAMGVVISNYYFFKYSHFFLGWTIVSILLICQLYVTLLIYESNGKKSLYWWLHGALVVFYFGINYLSAIYMIAYLPVAFTFWRKNEPGTRKKMCLYAGLVTGGIILVILWHPYAFIRLLGLLGVGSYAGLLSNTYTPFHSEETAFVYYGKMLLLNHLPLFIILALLWRPIFVQRFKENFVWIWMFGSILATHFLIFGSLDRYVSRYLLVAVVMLLLITGTALMQYLALPARKKGTTFLLAVLLIGYAVFHIIHIGKLISVYREGPAEEVLISEVLKLQSDTEPVALVQERILGHAHNKESYQAYLTKTGKEEANIYKTLMEAPLPDGVEALNVRYVSPEEYEENPEVINEYKHALRYVQTREDWSNSDENLLGLWSVEKFKPYYVELK